MNENQKAMMHGGMTIALMDDGSFTTLLSKLNSTGYFIWIWDLGL